MVDCWPAVTGDTCRAAEENRSFTGPDQPFIGLLQPVVKPSVGLITPLVGFRGISGFTIIELLVAIAVAAILSAIAAPGFLSFVRDNRLTTTTNELISDMLVARNEAVKRNLPVVICKTSNATIANPVCNTTATDTWTSGWIVFVDTNNNCVRDSPGGTIEPLIRVHGALLNTMTLAPLVPAVVVDCAGTGGTDIRNSISYRPSGRPLAFTGGTFKLCDERGVSKAKALIVSGSGQVRISDRKDGAGTPLDHAADAITCP
ncbi:MAG: GspH/FimT family pseudopilin [Gammaproteobacteria bacterium]|nr:GspH/FimT family pseudopilin [Gammaproteobacteria bacterium]